jgi:hypothetical protein
MVPKLNFFVILINLMLEKKINLLITLSDGYDEISGTLSFKIIPGISAYLELLSYILAILGLQYRYYIHNLFLRKSYRTKKPSKINTAYVNMPYALVIPFIENHYN